MIWHEGTTHKDWLYDGRPCSQEQWDNLVWEKAFVDIGPSIAGNPGPYWHVPHKDGDTVHRLYPKLLKTKWVWVVQQAMREYRSQENTSAQQTGD